MGLPLKDNDYHSYGDYLHWPEDVRYELIDGQAYLMAPAPTVSHQEIAGEISTSGKCIGGQALPGFHHAGGRAPAPK